jgi:hypothetical protein
MARDAGSMRARLTPPIVLLPPHLRRRGRAALFLCASSLYSLHLLSPAANSPMLADTAPSALLAAAALPPMLADAAPSALLADAANSVVFKTSRRHVCNISCVLGPTPGNGRRQIFAMSDPPPRQNVFASKFGGM